jgi:hypothetical protein
MILLPFWNSTSHNESPKVHEANIAKLELRVWFAVEEALHLVEKHKLDGFAERKRTCGNE